MNEVNLSANWAKSHLNEFDIESDE